MPRRRFIDKKAATTFTLVHRAQNDPKIHDPEASDRVFQEILPLNAQKKIKRREDLEGEFGPYVRDNEGEAATYGVYFDDTEYDYMQHMRDLGSEIGSHFVEAAQPREKSKGKFSLEDALRESSLDDRQSVGGESKTSSRASELLDPALLPSEFVQERSYQDQQNIPDALAGFQPDMDPRLREVLEALDDEAYVDDEDEMFEALAQDGVEVDPGTWEAQQWEGDLDDDGWETDDTVKAKSKEDKHEQSTAEASIPSEQSNVHNVHNQNPSHDHDWMKEYARFKSDAKSSALPARKPAHAETASSFVTGHSSLAEGRRKKRKGALTSSTGYSMTSSNLLRTEGLTLLDDRFTKIEEEYANDDYVSYDDGASVVSGVSGASRLTGISNASGKAPQLTAGVNAVMDEFLEGYSMSGKRRVKKGKHQTGMEQLDEIRKGLGPARLRSQKA